MELSTSEFWKAFFAAISAINLQSLDPGDVPQRQVRDEYDFVIVGAGTAGSVLSNRLTENPNWKVLLIEAGGPENAVSDVPLFEIVNHNTDRDYNYTTVKQKYACLDQGGYCEYNRGHVLGGTSAINSMMYVRGNKEDYDNWAKLVGSDDWSFDKVLPYFIKTENCTEPSLTKNSFRGTSGPQNVQFARYTTEMQEEYIQAGKEFGWKLGDYNSPQHEGIIGYTQFTIRGPSRASNSKTFLLPVKDRDNLHIIQRSFATRILFERNKAVGIEYIRNGKKHTVKAKKEVIISAGALETPKLLMLSGIGPRNELKRHNIPLLVDLPVGMGLQDHPAVRTLFKIQGATILTTDVWKTNDSIQQYVHEGQGPLTTSGSEAMAFFHTDGPKQPPNFQFIWHSFTQEVEKPQRVPTVRVISLLGSPVSRGSVTLKSRDYRDPPLIDPAHLADKHDVVYLRKGVKRHFEFMKTPSMQKYCPQLDLDSFPKCKDKKPDSEEMADCLVRHYTQTAYHPVSTARMGRADDRRAVVTPDLRVKHIQSLRVIDSSVIPFVPAANTNAPTMMVAEKGADLIKQAHAG